MAFGYNDMSASTQYGFSRSADGTYRSDTVHKDQGLQPIEASPLDQVSDLKAAALVASSEVGSGLENLAGEPTDASHNTVSPASSRRQSFSGANPEQPAADYASQLPSGQQPSAAYPAHSPPLPQSLPVTAAMALTTPPTDSSSTSYAPSTTASSSAIPQAPSPVSPSSMATVSSAASSPSKLPDATLLRSTPTSPIASHLSSSTTLTSTHSQYAPTHLDPPTSSHHAALPAATYLPIHSEPLVPTYSVSPPPDTHHLLASSPGPPPVPTDPTSTALLQARHIYTSMPQHIPVTSFPSVPGPSTPTELMANTITQLATLQVGPVSSTPPLSPQSSARHPATPSSLTSFARPSAHSPTFHSMLHQHHPPSAPPPLHSHSHSQLTTVLSSSQMPSTPPSGGAPLSPANHVSPRISMASVSIQQQLSDPYSPLAAPNHSSSSLPHSMSSQHTASPYPLTPTYQHVADSLMYSQTPSPTTPPALPYGLPSHPTHPYPYPHQPSAALPPVAFHSADQIVNSYQADDYLQRVAGGLPLDSGHKKELWRAGWDIGICIIEHFLRHQDPTRLNAPEVVNPAKYLTTNIKNVRDALADNPEVVKMLAHLRHMRPDIGADLDGRTLQDLAKRLRGIDSAIVMSCERFLNMMLRRGWSHGLGNPRARVQWAVNDFLHLVGCVQHLPLDAALWARVWSRGSRAARYVILHYLKHEQSPPAPVADGSAAAWQDAVSAASSWHLEVSRNVDHYTERLERDGAVCEMLQLLWTTRRDIAECLDGRSLQLLTMMAPSYVLQCGSFLVARLKYGWNKQWDSPKDGVLVAVREYVQTSAGGGGGGAGGMAAAGPPPHAMMGAAPPQVAAMPMAAPPMAAYPVAMPGMLPPGAMMQGARQGAMGMGQQMDGSQMGLPGAMGYH